MASAAAWTLKFGQHSGSPGNHRLTDRLTDLVAGDCLRRSWQPFAASGTSASPAAARRNRRRRLHALPIKDNGGVAPFGDLRRPEAFRDERRRGERVEMEGEGVCVLALTHSTLSHSSFPPHSSLLFRLHTHSSHVSLYGIELQLQFANRYCTTSFEPRTCNGPVKVNTSTFIHHPRLGCWISPVTLGGGRPRCILGQKHMLCSPSPSSQHLQSRLFYTVDEWRSSPIRSWDAKA